MNAPSRTIEHDLRILDLETQQLADLPEPAVIRQKMRRLLMDYHPDRNPDRPEWAHERTLRVIESGRRLLRTWRAAPTHRPNRQAPRTAGPQAQSRLAFQLIRRESEGYAIPVAGIRRVVAIDPTALRQLDEVTMHLDQDRLYPVLQLDGTTMERTTQQNQLTGARGIVFGLEDQDAHVLVIPREFVFVGIEEFDLRQGLKLIEPGLQVFWHNGAYAVPPSVALAPRGHRP